MPAFEQLFDRNELRHRSIILHRKTVCTRTSIFRSAAPLPYNAREAIVEVADKYTSLHLRYWDQFLDLAAPLLVASYWWSKETHAPRDNAQFSAAKELIQNTRNLTDRFICSTLVWRAYLDGTAGAIDISAPNTITSLGGVLGRFLEPSFVQAISEDFVLPDTISLNSKVLKQVFAPESDEQRSNMLRER